MLTSSDIRTLQEAYEAVYDDELRSEIMSDDYDELDILDELDDDELDEIVEEIVYEMLDEGYDFDDVEYIFEDVLFEARSARRRTGGPSYAEVKAKIDAKERAKKAKKAKAQPQPEATRQSTSTSRSRRVGSSSGERMGAGRRGLTPRKQEERFARRKAEREASEKSDRESARRERRERIASAVKGALSKAGEMAKGVKQRIGAKLRGAQAAAGIAGSIAKDEAKRARRSVEDQAGKAVDVAKSGLKGLIRRGAERVQRGAEGVARRMSEEVETFDIVLDFLLSEGIAETLEEAQWLMVNELDYEDVDAILEAYEVLDESQIMSVSGKGGRVKYKINRNIERAQNAAARARQRNQGNENSTRNDRNYENDRNYDSLERTLKKNIKRLNAKPGEDDSGYYGDDDTSGGTRHYGLSRTNQSARRRRASGR